jgi:hypothetical protein
MLEAVSVAFDGGLVKRLLLGREALAAPGGVGLGGSVGTASRSSKVAL